MTAPRVESIACANPVGIHRMAYYEWGDADNPDVLLCVHGLTRNGRDFDVLASRLQDRFRVICPDIVGRGLSDWLAQPMSYNVAQYAADMVTLLGRLQPKRLSWVGTSMGGLIGLTYGGLVAQAKMPATRVAPARMNVALADPVVPISRLVLNDVGPRVESPSLLRIAQYLAEPTVFATFEQAVGYMRTTAASFGPHSDEQWALLTRHYFVQVEGQWVKHYDPAISAAFAAVNQDMVAKGEQLLWASYASLQVPTLILRGAQSDLLASSTVQQMCVLNPQARAVEFAGVGHAPSLLMEDQLDTVQGFLNEG
jgi:pimeloyl-ACP methyl ester carboxylesterase